MIFPVLGLVLYKNLVYAMQQGVIVMTVNCFAFNNQGGVDTVEDRVCVHNYV